MKDIVCLQHLKHFTFCRNDLNGFVQLFFDNCSTVLLLIGILLNAVWVAPRYDGMTEEYYQEAQDGLTHAANNMVWGRVIPGLALTMIFGNTFYAYLACRLSYKEGRFGQVSALPFGINTPAAFGFIFSVILPAFKGQSIICKQDFENGASPQVWQSCLESAIEESWKVGVLSNFVGGAICIFIGLFGKLIGKVTPIGVLLSSLATIGFAFLMVNNMVASFADPIAGVLPLLIMAVGYFADVPFWKLPTAGVIVIVGTILGWANGTVNAAAVHEATQYVQWTGVGTGFSAFDAFGNIGPYFGVIIPFAIQAASGTLMNVHSAERAGDSYPVRVAMMTDGTSCILGSFFGTPFMTTVYIGHPAYKKIGATMGYSVLNCVIFFFVAMSGLFALISAVIPSVAITPVIIFVGIMISEEALRSMPFRQYPIFLLALLPGICDWAMQQGINFDTMGTAYFGAVAIAKSNIFFAMILGCIFYFALDRNFLPAVAWSIVAAISAAIGLIHQTTITLKDYSLPGGEYCIQKSQLHISNNSTCPDKYLPCANGDSTMCGYALTVKWRFAVTYLMVAATLLILWACQKYSNGKLVPSPIPYDDDLTESTTKEDRQENTEREVEPKKQDSSFDSASDSSEEIKPEEVQLHII